MGNVLQVFTNESFGEVRTINLNGECWFVGKDIAEKLGYTNPQKALRDHVDSEDKGVNEMVTPGGNQPIVVINESGMYSLIIKSKLPKAKEFKRWVTSEILPSLRKTGNYSTTQVQYDNIMPFTMEVTNGIQNTNYLMSNMSNYLISSESRIQEVKNQTEYTLNNIENKTNNVINILGLRKRNIVVITEQLKFRLSNLVSRDIKATDKLYKEVAKKYLLDYNALIWEDISVNKFEEICESIKGLSLTDIENILLKQSNNTKSTIKKLKPIVKNNTTKSNIENSSQDKNKTRKVVSKGKEYYYEPYKEIEYIPIEQRLGSKNINSQGLEMEIIAYRHCTDIDVKFTINKDIIKGTNYGNFKKGLISSKYHPTVRGVGYLGEGRFLVNYKNTSTTTKEYRTWVSKIHLCYGKGSEGSVTMCKEWHNYQTFAEWYDRERMGKNMYLKIKHNETEYNPTNCYLSKTPR